MTSEIDVIFRALIAKSKHESAWVCAQEFPEDSDTAWPSPFIHHWIQEQHDLYRDSGMMCFEYWANPLPRIDDDDE